MNSDSIYYFAKTDYQNQFRTFGIRREDRRLHIYIVGSTGAGKSTLLKNLIIQNLRSGDGVGLIDPHGDLVESVIDCVPSRRTGDVVYFNPADHSYPIGFNILESVDPALKPLVTSHVVSVFKNIWQDSWGPRLEYILYNSVMTLLEAEGSTLLGIPRLLSDDEFRKRVLSKVKDPAIKMFWKKEFEEYTDTLKKEAISPIQNKVGQFLNNPKIRNIVGQVRNKVDMSFMMENRRILLANLSKGKIGDDSTSLLGSLLTTKIYLSALRRVEIPENERKDFYLYIDECQNLATPIFSSILSEARKYGLNLVLAHQYLAQIPEEIQKSILGNVGTLISFRLGSRDALSLEHEFSPNFSSSDLQSLDKHKIYLKMAIKGLTSRSFSAVTLPPINPGKDENNRRNIIKSSREKYARKKDDIETKLGKWYKSWEGKSY